MGLLNPFYVHVLDNVCRTLVKAIHDHWNKTLGAKHIMCDGYLASKWLWTWSKCLSQCEACHFSNQ
jgi:hypothetical protein